MSTVSDCGFGAFGRHRPGLSWNLTSFGIPFFSLENMKLSIPDETNFCMLKNMFFLLEDLKKKLTDEARNCGGPI